MHKQLGMWGLALALMSGAVGCADVDAAESPKDSATAQQLWPGWPSSSDDEEDEDEDEEDTSSAGRPQGGDVDDDWFGDERDVGQSADAEQEPDEQEPDEQDADEQDADEDASDWTDDEGESSEDEADESGDDRDVSSDEDEDDDGPWWGGFPWPWGGGPVIGGVTRR